MNTQNYCNRYSGLSGRIVLFALLLVQVIGPIRADEQRNATEQFRVALNTPGAFVLMRHALAPGTGDPDQFSEQDCSTQRNLSQGGRDQAVRIGAKLREYSAGPFAVYSSAWCRCMDTAKLLDLGPVEKLPPLNSFFRQWEREQLQTDQLNNWMAEREPDGIPVLVTHQVNITALTDVYPTSGEMVVVTLDNDHSVRVLGRLAID